MNEIFGKRQYQLIGAWAMLEDVGAALTKAYKNTALLTSLFEPDNTDIVKILEISALIRKASYLVCHLAGGCREILYHEGYGFIPNIEVSRDELNFSDIKLLLIEILELCGEHKTILDIFRDYLEYSKNVDDNRCNDLNGLIVDGIRNDLQETVDQMNQVPEYLRQAIEKMNNLPGFNQRRDWTH